MACREVPLAIARDHPAYAGHFPGRPILPGVVLLSEALAAIEAQSGRPPQEWSIASAKFLRTVAPGAPLTLVHESAAPDRIQFEIRSAGELVASGTFSLAGRGEPR
jgi:3-hydroxymyristoyl/3-hydroxydecanoyl-(acyl carrier protein) dehydratase